MKDGGRRIATSRGAMLVDPAGLGLGPGAGLDAAGEMLFEPDYWAARGELVAVSGGRGAAWFLEDASHRWVLRRYRRGGSVARLLGERYLWTGEARVRAFAEFRLLAGLIGRGLPVPKPIAARYQRSGMVYRCDLITQRIADAQPLSAMLASCALNDAGWRAIGATIARLHQGGVDHADLNAHNILIGARGEVSVIDFDRGRLREGARERSAWTERNLRRLRRSLAKIARDLPPGRFSAEAWACLLAGYGSFGGQ